MTGKKVNRLPQTLLELVLEIVIVLSFLYLANAGFGFQESNVTLVIIAAVLAIPICINAYEIRQQLKAE